MVELSLSTLVQPRCMSWLLQRRGRVSNLDPAAWVRFPAGEKVISIFSPVTFVKCLVLILN